MTTVDHNRTAAPGEADTTRTTRAAILAHAVAVLAGAGPGATGATVIYPDGTTAYLSRATAIAMRGGKGAGGQA